MVRLLRLNLFMGVAVTENSTVKAIAYAARTSQESWMAAVEGDFKWVVDADRRANLNLLQHVTDL